MRKDRKLYLLRDERKVFGTKFSYLELVSRDGLTVHYSYQPSRGRQFTKEQMVDFRRTHPHIKGRVVLLAREIER